jgi:uncharacterized integral membrane protein
MGRIVFSVILLVLLTILIVMNLGPTTPINLFGARFQGIPVVAVAMLSFALGLVYSLFLYIGQYVHRSSRDRLAKKHRDIEERERKLTAAQTDTGVKAEPAGQAPAAGAEEDASEAGEQKPSRSAVARFFGRFR